MPNLVDQSFFVREIYIPNLGDKRVVDNLNLYIEKYEPEILMATLGYYLYKAFLSEANNVYSKSVLGLTLKDDEQIKVGTTVGLIAGTSTFTFDGTLGTSDYRGYNIVITEIGGRGILISGEDFSWDYQTGIFNLLHVNDKLQPNQVYNIHFQNKPLSVDNVIQTVITPRMADLVFGKEYTYLNKTYNWRGLIHGRESLIAYYVYYMRERDLAKHSTGVGTVVSQGESSIPVSPADKMIVAWNEMAKEVEWLYSFLWANREVYPEFDQYQFNYCRNRFRKNTNSPF